MRLSMMLAVLLFLCTTAWGKQPSPKPEDIGSIQIRQELSEALADVAFIEARLRSIEKNPKATAEIQQRLRRLTTRLTGLAAVVPAAIPRAVTVVRPAPLPGPVRPRVITRSAFEALWRDVKKQSATDDKLRAVAAASSSSFFTVVQVTRLLGLFGSSAAKLECARRMAHRIVDREYLFLLVEAFTVEGDKEKLRKMLRM